MEFIRFIDCDANMTKSMMKSNPDMMECDCENAYIPCDLCGFDDCEKVSLAMAYVPMQKWGKTYDVCTALKRGTIFPDLDFPFIGEEAVPRG